MVQFVLITRSSTRVELLVQPQDHKYNKTNPKYINDEINKETMHKIAF